MVGAMPEELDEGSFVRVCSVGDVPEGELHPFTVPGVDDGNRLLVHDGSEIHSLGRICPHQGADLSEGLALDGVLWCPVHSSGFDLRTGAALHPPASAALPVYRVRIQSGDVYVSLRPEA